MPYPFLPPEMGITPAQVMKLPGWLAIDRDAGIIVNLPTREECEAAFGIVEGVEFLPTHIFEEPLPEERTGTRILHGIAENQRAKAAPEYARAAAARLPACLRCLLLAVDELAANDPKAHATLWAVANWTGTMELSVRADVRRLMARDLAGLSPGPEGFIWPTLLGGQVARLSRASRIV